MMERKNRQNRSNSEESEGRLWRISSKLLLGLIVVLLALTSMQCSVKAPEAPQWNTTLTVPLINRTYAMTELIEKAGQDGLSWDADSSIVYSLSYDVDTISLDGSNLTVPDLAYSTSQTMGPISIDPPTVAPISTALSDIALISLAIPGPIPSVSFSLQKDLPTISNFTSATISSGQMLVIVSNQLGINLDTVNIEIYDIGNAATVDVYSFAGGLTAGTVDTAVFVLDGKTLSSSLRFQADCHNEAATILSVANLELMTTMVFVNGLTASSATAQVPALAPIDFSQQADLGSPGDTDVITSAELTSGSLDLTITNRTALDATLTIDLSDLDSSGTSFQASQLIAAGTAVVINRDISNYTLRPTDLTAPQSININVSASIPGSGVNLVTVNENDDFSVTAAISNLNFASVNGIFASTGATFDPVVEQIDIPEGFDGFELVSAIITLEIENGVNLPGYLDLQLSDGNGKVLVVSDSVAAGAPGATTLTTIVVVDSSFLSPLPDSIIIDGSATFGDGVNAGTLSAGDFIYARITITAPIEAVITETAINTDIESESVDQTDIDLITDHISEARFIYTITNHMPLGASVVINLGGDTTTLAGQDNTVIPDYTIGGNGELTIIAAPTIGGIVPADSVSSAGEQTIVITSSDLTFLENDPLFIGTQITLEGSNGQAIKLTNNDYITITGYLEVDYLVDSNF